MKDQKIILAIHSTEHWTKKILLNIETWNKKGLQEQNLHTVKFTDTSKSIKKKI